MFPKNTHVPEQQCQNNAFQKYLSISPSWGAKFNETKRKHIFTCHRRNSSQTRLHDYSSHFEPTQLQPNCSLRDFSLISGSQQSNELKDALDAEMEKTKEMEASMKKLDEEMKRSDELLSQMIPKSVAEKVKSGLNPVETCEVSRPNCVRLW